METNIDLQKQESREQLNNLYKKTFKIQIILLILFILSSLLTPIVGLGFLLSIIPLDQIRFITGLMLILLSPVTTFLIIALGFFLFIYIIKGFRVQVKLKKEKILYKRLFISSLISSIALVFVSIVMINYFVMAIKENIKEDNYYKKTVRVYRVNAEDINILKEDCENRRLKFREDKSASGLNLENIYYCEGGSNPSPFYIDVVNDAGFKRLCNENSGVYSKDDSEVGSLHCKTSQKEYFMPISGH